MGLNLNSSSAGHEFIRKLAEQINEEMKSTITPVTVFVGIETVFGFFGNLVIWYVFLLHYRRCNFKYFVLCLAFIDTTSTLTTMPGEIISQLFWYMYPGPLICKIKSFFNMFTVCGSAFTLLLIAVDRFRKVCRPLKWQIKPKMAMILIFAQLTFSFVVAFPVPFLWGTHSYHKHYKGFNVTVTVCEQDTNFKNTQYPLIYTIFTQLIISAIMTAMVVLYVFVGKQLFSVKPACKTPSKHFRVHHRDSFGLTSDGDDSTQNNIESKDDKLNAVTDFRNDGKRDNVKELVFHTITSFEFVPNSSPNLGNKGMNVGNSTKKKNLRKIRTKTLIMLILTTVFIFTTVLYLTLLNMIANNVLQSLSKTQKSIYFFFFRLYFINHAINPVLYGVLDPQFRRVLQQIFWSRTQV